MKKIPFCAHPPSFHFDPLRADNGRIGGPFLNGSARKRPAIRVFQNQNVKCPSRCLNSAATPLFGDHLFPQFTDEKTKACGALCLERKTGKVLWARKWRLVQPG